MKRFSQFLKEFVFSDLKPRTGEWKQIPTDKLKQAAHQPPINIDHELFRLLDISYAYIGGHVDFKKPSDLPSNHTIWYAIDMDGDKVPDALKFAKSTPYGIKWTGGATDGSPQAKKAYVDATFKALNTPGNFCEVSDALMHILITRYNVPHVRTQKEVEKIIGKKVRWIGPHPDGKYPGYTGFYVRNLGGHDHMKILLGKPR